MVDRRIAEACADALEVLLESLLEHAATIPARDAPGVYLGRDPILGRVFTSAEDHADLRLAICKALIADVRFRRETGMSLPLRRDEIEALVDDGNPWLNVIGLYGGSQRNECWHPEHPPFAEFVSGVMSCESAPIEIWQDRSLREAFPPRPLPGLCDGALHPHWQSPETVAMLRDIDQMCAAREAAEAHNSV